MRHLRAAGVAFALLAVSLAGHAAAQVDPGGSWRTLHTRHFRVHFRPAYREVASQAAREAERAYALLAGELRVPRGVIDLTLADDIDAANGFTTTFPSNRITVWLTPPGADPGLQHYDSWLRLVIVHELAHVFHLDRARGLWGGLQAVFGRAPGLFPNEYQPPWVVEGLATYYESKFTTAGRVRDDFYTQVLAAEAAAGAARSPWDASFFTRWPAGHAPYAYGSRFVQSLTERASDTVVPRLVEATAGQTIPYRIGRPLRRVTGGFALANEWPPATAPEVDTAAGPRGRVVLGRLRSTPVARVSPDGRFVAFLHDDGKGAARLRIAEAAGWRVLRSHRVTGAVRYDWSGDTLIVAQLEFISRRRIRSDLYHWGPDGSWRRVTRGARLTGPRGGGGVLAGVAITPADNGPVVDGVTWPDAPGTTWGEVAPSPDGAWIAATRHRDGHWALVRWPRGGGRPDRAAVLFESGSVVTDPSWTGDGAILFVASSAGMPQVHRWADAAETMTITADPLGASHPAALPDGTLLYTTLGAEGWELRQARPVPLAAATAGVAPPFDSAAGVPARETGYTLWPSLRPHFWIPLFFDAGLAGRFAGASTAGGDAVGRYAYLARGLVSWEPARVLGSLLVISDAAGNPTFDLSVANDWSPIGTDSTGHDVSEESRDAAVGATFVSRRWRRTASLRLAAEYEGTRYVSEPDTVLAAICTGCTRRDFLGAAVSVGLSHYVVAPLAISPQDGFAWSVTFRRREQQASPRWSEELRSRLSLYARIPVGGAFASPVVALRLAAGATRGPAVQTFAVGGVSSGTYDLGFGVTLGTRRAFPVRGFAAGAVRGRRAATASAELRLPVALVSRAIGHLPLGVDKLSVSLFGDAGDAWNPPTPARLTRLAAVGGEVVGDVTVSYDFPLRARLGMAWPLTALAGSGARRIQVYLALAADF